MQITKINAHPAMSTNNRQNVKNQPSFGLLEKNLGFFMAGNFSKIAEKSKEFGIKDFKNLFTIMRDCPGVEFAFKKYENIASLHLYAFRHDAMVADFGRTGNELKDLDKFCRSLTFVEELLENPSSFFIPQNKDFMLAKKAVENNKNKLSKALQELKENFLTPMLEKDSKIDIKNQLKLIEEKNKEINMIKSELAKSIDDEIKTSKHKWL